MIRLIPLLLVIPAIWGILYLARTAAPSIEPRLPGADNAPEKPQGTQITKIEGTLTSGSGQPADLNGNWPEFRGPGRDAIARDENVVLIENWSQDGPEVLWDIEVGEGYAGAAILGGRAFLVDYDRQNQQDVIRCLGLDSGIDIWRYAYPVSIKRNHGMSRTVPAVTSEYLVALGPKGHVTCLKSDTGEFLWMIDLEAEFGSTIPPWYAGQCPLIENGHAIIAPSGDVLMIAVDCATGEVVWQAPNPQGWSMTHSSIMPMDMDGRRIYLYCASGGVYGVDAANGELLWQTGDWKIRIANVPSPLVLDENRVFFCGGYNSGSAMMRLANIGDSIEHEVLFRLPPEVFGSAQHTPIYYEGYIYGVRPDEQLVCLDAGGNEVWTSGSANKFGLGPYTLINDIIYVMNDTGLLSMVRAAPAGFELLDQASILHGHDSWGPMAYSEGLLILRDMNRMACIRIGNRE